MTRPLILSPLRRTEADAFKFARVVHAGQTDKAGKPYLGHLERVHARLFALSAGCPFWDAEQVDEAEQVAWLHDTMEDTETSETSLEREMFSANVVSGVCALTRDHIYLWGDTYEKWIGEIAHRGVLATILVKLADVEDNSDPERLALLPEGTQARLLRKYTPAKEVLRAAARAKGWQG